MYQLAFPFCSLSLPIQSILLININNKVNCMSGQSHQCEICVRLGKRECGYHRFKQEYLSKINASHQKQDVFAQTRSSINRIQPSPIKPQRQAAYTPEKAVRQPIKIQYSSSPRPVSSQMHFRYVSTPSKPNQYIPPMPHMERSTLTQSRQIPILTNNSSSRISGNQILYYPIYPVYEVVYQPVVNNASFISTPSRVIYQ